MCNGSAPSQEIRCPLHPSLTRGNERVFLDQYFHTKNGYTLISAQQGSTFAKEVARDFNPIHDPDNRRFCVPGDLLFALGLARYGLSQRMAVRFSDRVGADTPLIYPSTDDHHIQVADDAGQPYLDIERSGDTVDNPDVLTRFIRSYVEFSGQTFPFILVPLMRDAGVMFNPRRPFVVYAHMSVHLDDTAISSPTLTLADRRFDVTGRRGNAHFEFSVLDDDRLVGRGTKTLLLSGLQPYDEAAMADVVSDFNHARDQYLAEID